MMHEISHRYSFVMFSILGLFSMVACSQQGAPGLPGEPGPTTTVGSDGIEGEDGISAASPPFYCRVGFNQQSLSFTNPQGPVGGVYSADLNIPVLNPNTNALNCSAMLYSNLMINPTTPTPIWCNSIQAKIIPGNGGVKQLSLACVSPQQLLTTDAVSDNLSANQITIGVITCTDAILGGSNSLSITTQGGFWTCA